MSEITLSMLAASNGFGKTKEHITGYEFWEKTHPKPEPIPKMSLAHVFKTLWAGNSKVEVTYTTKQSYILFDVNVISAGMGTKSAYCKIPRTTVNSLLLVAAGNPYLAQCLLFRRILFITTPVLSYDLVDWCFGAFNYPRLVLGGFKHGEFYCDKSLSCTDWWDTPVTLTSRIYDVGGPDPSKWSGLVEQYRTGTMQHGFGRCRLLVHESVPPHRVAHLFDLCLLENPKVKLYTELMGVADTTGDDCELQP